MIEAAIAAGSTLAIAAIAFGAKSLLGLGNRVSVVETLHADVKADVTEIKGDVKCIDQKLQRLLGRQEERNGHP